MKSVRTVVCKLNPTAAQAKRIDSTLNAFASACNHISEVARAIHSTNKVKVQHACYKEVREKFRLSANLTIRAIARVCAALKIPAKIHSAFKPSSIDYDARIFSFREWDWTFSLTLLDSRERLEAKLGDWQRQALKGTKPTSAVLVKKRDGRYFLHVQISKETPAVQEPDGFLGVDLGRRRVAVDSDGQIYESTEIKRVRQHYLKVRRSAQSKGTRGAHALLKRLSGREHRHASHINHVISREIVNKAKSTGRGIALEDLTGIRERTKVRRAQRYMQQSWAFYQLRQFVAYKAALAGVLLVLVDPRYTSQTCSKCSQRGHRDGLKFSCSSCGFVGDADINAAFNIAAAGAAVNRPETRESLLHEESCRL
jgi:putative transposase